MRSDCGTCPAVRRSLPCKAKGKGCYLGVVCAGWSDPSQWQFGPDGSVVGRVHPAGVRHPARPYSCGHLGVVFAEWSDPSEWQLGSDDAVVGCVQRSRSVATLQGHTGEVLSVSYSPDGSTLASGSLDRTVRLWDVSSGQEIATLQGHTHGVTSVSYSPNGQTLASGSLDRTVRLWDVASGQEIATLQGHTDRVQVGVVFAGWSDFGQWQFGQDGSVVGRGQRAGDRHRARPYG